MSSVQFNRGELARALASFLGVKGAFSLDQEQTILPVISLGEVSASPYLRYGIPVLGTQAAAAVAAEFAYVWAVPGLNQALQITRIIVSNATAAAQSLVLRAMTGANAATVGADNTSQFGDCQPPDTSSTGLISRPSRVSGGTHGVSTLGVFGYSVFTAPIGTTVFELADPGITLFSNDPAGGVLVVTNLTANDTLRVTFGGREWPLPG